MAEEKPADERTEAPTQRRREKAREDGDLFASRELATAMVGVAGGLWLYGFGQDLADALRAVGTQSFSLDREDIIRFQPVSAVQAMLSPLLSPLLALAGLVLVAIIGGQAFTGSLTFNTSLIAPKASRINPLAGLKRLFGPKGLIELFKALLKAGLLIGVSAWLLWRDAPLIMQLSAMPLGAALATLADIGLKLFLWLSLGLVLIASGDVPVQFLQWIKRLRMSLQDVKDEVKQQEGSPEMKWAMRRMARESLKRASRTSMADATVVLTNPTHFAVALRYRPEIDTAPVILARGRGLVAEVIRELAAEQGTMILSYPSVARAIYFTGRVGQIIRPDLYAAVATILAFVLRTRFEPSASGTAAAPEEAPEVEAPESARFDADGKRSEAAAG